MMNEKTHSDGGTAKYYELPDTSNTLRQVMIQLNMSYPMATIFELAFKYGARQIGESVDIDNHFGDYQELQDLIRYYNLTFSIGNIVKAVYRLDRAAHTDARRDVKKIIFYADDEIKRRALDGYDEDADILLIRNIANEALELYPEKPTPTTLYRSELSNDAAL